jgi:CrcB protein
MARGFGEEFPIGTLVVNVTGSLLIGFFAALTGPEGRVAVGPEIRAFFMVGLCGGYTTFSAFSLQTMELMRGGAWLYAGANAVLSVVLCVAAVWLGQAMAVGLGFGRGV